LKANQDKWQTATDELESAIKLIEKYTGHEQTPLERINLPESPNCTAIAFALPSLINTWHGVVCEIGLDSTCIQSLCYAI